MTRLSLMLYVLEVMTGSPVQRERFSRTCTWQSLIRKFGNIYLNAIGKSILSMSCSIVGHPRNTNSTKRSVNFSLRYVWNANFSVTATSAISAHPLTPDFTMTMPSLTQNSPIRAHYTRKRKSKFCLSNWMGLRIFIRKIPMPFKLVTLSTYIKTS